MFKWFNIKSFLDTPEEWHAFLVGFFEMLPPWPSRYHLTMKPMGELLKEYHYYMAGRALGFVTLLLILIGLANLVLEVLL